jgi:hypothetical protein
MRDSKSIFLNLPGAAAPASRRVDVISAHLDLKQNCQNAITGIKNTDFELSLHYIILHKQILKRPISKKT